MEATKKLFVGSLSWNLGWQDLKEAFGEHGEVVYTKVITDRDTGRSKGFGFVEFSNVEDAIKAKDAMQWVELDGRPIMVDFAEEKPRDHAWTTDNHAAESEEAPAEETQDSE